jgi:hypothetical protein
MVKNRRVRNFHIRAQFQRSFCDSAGSRLYQPILYRATVGKLICSYHLYLHMSLLITCHFPVLVVYKSAESSRSSVSLRRTTLTCVAIMTTAGLVLNSVDSFVLDSPLCRNISRTISFSMLVIQSGFVYLLSSQHRSFLGSVQSKEEGARWFAPIAGIGSISSTVAAFAVSPLVNVLGLPILLIAASFLFFAKCMLRGHSLPGGAKGTNGKFGWFRLV